MCTEQAPHCAMPQPYFVPVSRFARGAPTEAGYRSLFARRTGIAQFMGYGSCSTAVAEVSVSGRGQSPVPKHFKNFGSGRNVENYLPPSAIEGLQCGMCAETGD